MSVNKKIGKAVVRNKIKRQVRSIISQIEIKSNVDIFIIVRSKVLDIDYEEMNKQILYLLRKQKMI
jgi:ribonuclease P protein component